MVIGIFFVQAAKLFPRSAIKPFNLSTFRKNPLPTPTISPEDIDRNLLAYKLSQEAFGKVKALLETQTFNKVTSDQLMELTNVISNKSVGIQLENLGGEVIEIHKLLQEKSEQLAILNNKLVALKEAYHEARHLPGRNYDSWLRFRLDNLLFLERSLPIFPTHGAARIAKFTRLLRKQNADLIEHSASAIKALRAEKRRVKNFQEMYAIELNHTKSQILALFERHQNLCREQLHELRQASKHHSVTQTSMSTVKAQESLPQRLSNKVQSFLHTLFNTRHIQYAEQRS